MFKVTKLTVDELTGNVDLEYVFDVGQGPGTGNYKFPDRALAYHHLDSAKHYYISTTYEKWVRHKQKLSEVGKSDVYYTMSRAQSIERCMNGIHWIATHNLQEVCKVMIQLEYHLRNILPAPGNPSYESQLLKLNHLIEFCKSNLKNQ
ncbi:MAG: hypothetical protein ACOYMF_05400 [Bacteroidales bacterium]